MRYTKPTIQNVCKAASLIMGTINKKVDLVDSPPTLRTDPSAYEADE